MKYSLEMCIYKAFRSSRQIVEIIMS